VIRVKFIGGNSRTEERLWLETEIQLLEGLKSPNVSFTYKSDCMAEDINENLHDEQADVIHLSSHGVSGTLTFPTRDGRGEADLTEDVLLTSLASNTKVVFLSACQSDALARALARVEKWALGFHKKPNIGAASHAGVAFYKRLFAGASIADAHKQAASVFATLDRSGAELTLYGPGAPESFRLISLPAVVATCDECSGGLATLRFGVFNPPEGTKRIVWVTTSGAWHKVDKDARDRWGMTGIDVDEIAMIYWTDDWQTDKHDFHFNMVCLDGSANIVFSQPCTAAKALANRLSLDCSIERREASRINKALDLLKQGSLRK
jgi:hypothetical protein